MGDILKVLNGGVWTGIPAIKGDPGGLTDQAKAALLACFEHVAWTDGNGQEYYDDLEAALYDTTWLVSNTLTGCTTSNEGSSVTKGAPYSAVITASAGFTLTGATVSIIMGDTDITGSAYNNGTISIAAVTAAVEITVEAAEIGVSSISAVYTPSGSVFETDALDSLKADLVVTATYADTTTGTVPASDYSLSGTLEVGTSTITVSFGGKTTTFTVTVSAVLYSFDDLAKNGAYQQYHVSGNHFIITGSRRNYESDWQFDKGSTPGSTSDRTSWETPMFSISEGATVQMKLKNVSISSSKAGYFNFLLFRYEAYDSAKGVVGFQNAAGTGVTYGAGSTTKTLVEATATSPLNATAHYFGFYIYNASTASQNYTIEFDLELYVNGVRYV